MERLYFTMSLPELSSLPVPSHSSDPMVFEPDLTLRFYTIPHDESEWLIRVYGVAYSAFSYLELNGFDMGFRDVPRELIESVQIRLRDLAERYPTSSEARSELVAIGQFMWSYILPPDLMTVYKRASAEDKKGERISGVSSVLILTDADLWLPYELAVPPKNHSSLSEVFDVTRFVEGQGRLRQTSFPLGAIHQTVDADIQAALPDFRPLKWDEAMGFLQTDMPLAKGLSSTENIAGYHITKAAGSLRGQATALTEHSSDINWSRYVQQHSDKLYAKSPLVTLSYIAPTEQSGELSNVDDLVSIMRSGAGALVAKWWATSPGVDRVFWQAFYTALAQGEFLGRAITVGRQSVQTVSNNPLDWLAFQGIGDPMATGYVLRDVNGILCGRCVTAAGEEHIKFKTGETYHFIISLTQKQPVFDEGPRYRVRPWETPPTDLLVEVAHCETEWDLRRETLNRVDWDLYITPTQGGRVALFIECYTQDGSLFASLEHPIPFRITENVSAKATFAQPVVDTHMYDVIHLDLTQDDHYLFRNKPMSYGAAQKPINRLAFLQLVHQLASLKREEFKQTSVGVSHQVADLLGTPWWNELDKNVHIQILDRLVRLPWELSAFGDEYWGSRFAIGHLQEATTKNKKTLHLKRIALSINTECENQRQLFDFFAQQEAISISDMHKTLGQLSKIYADDPVAHIAVSHSRIKAQLLHLTVKSNVSDIQTKHIALGDIDSTELLLSLSELGDIETGKQLRNYPIVFLNQTTISGQFAECSDFAYAFLRWGAQAVISPMCTVPDQFAHQFARTFYENLLYNDVEQSIGQVLLDTRRLMWERTHNPLSLAYLLFGDPLTTIRV